jgi:multicomponent Na+:H+ antiporter subunit D
LDSNPLILGPVFIPLGAAFLCLPLVRSNRWQRVVAVVATVVSWACSAVILYENWNEGVQVYRLGAWPPPYSIMLVADMLSATFALMTTTVLAAGALYIYGSRDRSAGYPAFVPAFLVMCAGLGGAFYTGDIFTLFIFIEVMVIASISLVATSDNPLGLEAAMKYLLISAMGSLFLLIGIAAIYTTSGALNMADISRALQNETDPNISLLRASAVMLTAAFLLKSAVFPFHFWQPDFHTTAPTAVGAMLSSVVVKVGVYGLIRLTTLLVINQANTIQTVLLLLGIIGIFFGSLAALRTYHIKRLLAYSTFGQIGFILVGIGWGTATALIGAIVYAVNHALIKSSLLMLSGVVSSRTRNKTGAFRELAGAGKRAPFLGLLYLLGGMALSGVPPMNGFISKLALVQGGIDAESWLLVGMVVGAGILTLLYMTRAWTLIFQRVPDGETAPLKDPADGDSLLAPAILIGLCVLLGLYAVPLVDVATRTVEQILTPGVYITAVLGPGG